MHPLLTLFQVAIPTVEIRCCFATSTDWLYIGGYCSRRLGAKYFFNRVLMLSYLTSHISRVVCVSVSCVDVGVDLGLGLARFGPIWPDLAW